MQKRRGNLMSKPIDDILKQYPYIGEDIQKAQAELNRYIQLQQEARNPLKGQELTGMPHSYNVSNTTYNAVEKIIDSYQTEIDRYAAEINELLNLKKWMDKAFAQLTEDERRAINLRYEKGMGIHKIGYTMRRGTDTIRRLIDEAKGKIKKIMVMRN
jgi:DNA-directed RNA polymerase specialized sigma24 family protein